MLICTQNVFVTKMLAALDEDGLGESVAMPLFYFLNCRKLDFGGIASHYIIIIIIMMSL